MRCNCHGHGCGLLRQRRFGKSKTKKPSRADSGRLGLFARRRKIFHKRRAFARFFGIFELPQALPHARGKTDNRSSVKGKGNNYRKRQHQRDIQLFKIRGH